MKSTASRLFLFNASARNFKLTRNFCCLTPRREPTQPLSKPPPKYVSAQEAVSVIESGM